MEDKGSVVLWLTGDGRGRRHGALRVKEASVIEERPITQSTISYNNFFFNKKQRKNCRVFFFHCPGILRLVLKSQRSSCFYLYLLCAGP